MDKVNLLFLPGLLNDASVFEEQIPMLAELANIAVADLTLADSIPAMAAEALKQAPGERIALAGLSLGGYVAFEIIRQAPERVRALALLDTTARPDTPESTATRKQLMQLAETDFPAVTEALLPRLSHPEHVDLPTVRGVIQSMAISLGKDVFLRQERAIIGRVDSRPTLARIECPTLVLCGRNDVITPPEVHEEMAAAIKGARLEIIDECGHLSPLDQPERVTEALRAWLLSLPP